jgi:hypothetical protein
LVNQKSGNNPFDKLDAHFDSKGCPSRGLIPQRFGFPKLICKEKNRKEKIATKLRINGLGFFSKWTGLKFVKKRISFGFRKNQRRAVKGLR